MYESFEPGSKITLWCHGICSTSTENSEPNAKRRKTTTTPTTISSSSSELTDDVDHIFKELKSKHSDMANPKLRLWTKLIEKGQYDDYDNPPQIPGSPAPEKRAFQIHWLMQPQQKLFKTHMRLRLLVLQLQMMAHLLGIGYLQDSKTMKNA